MVLLGAAKRRQGPPARPSFRAGVAGAEKLVDNNCKTLTKNMDNKYKALSKSMDIRTIH